MRRSHSNQINSLIQTVRAMATLESRAALLLLPWLALEPNACSYFSFSLLVNNEEGKFALEWTSKSDMEHGSRARSPNVDDEFGRKRK